MDISSINDPCKGLDEKYNKLKTQLDNKIADWDENNLLLEDKLNSLTEEPSAVDVASKKVNENKNKADEELDKSQDKLEGVAGDCLDGATKAVNDMFGNSTDLVDSMFDGISDTFSSLSSLISNMFLNNCDGSDLIPNLDKFLGCLSTSDCVPASELDSMSNYINSSVDKLPMADDGTCDKEKMKEKIHDKIDSNEILSDEMKTKLKDFTSDAVDNSQEIKSKIKDKAKVMKETTKQKRKPNTSIKPVWI